MNLIKSPAVLTVKDIHYCWPDRAGSGLGEAVKSGVSENKVLEDVSFELLEGQITALFGPNGSGKSTLMKIISGIISLNRFGCSGQVQYRQEDFLSLSSSLRAQRVAYVSADLRAEFPLTAQEAVSLGRTSQSWGLVARASKEDRANIQWAMEQAFCWQLRNRNLSTLSGGERQLVAVACALAQGAKLLLLDESMSKMDLNHQALMGLQLRTLASQGWTILLVCHDINLASEWADCGILLKKGRVMAQGAIQEILTQEWLKKLYPDVDFIVGRSPASGAPKVFFGNK